jgi:hypothetical protein
MHTMRLSQFPLFFAIASMGCGGSTTTSEPRGDAGGGRDAASTPPAMCSGDGGGGAGGTIQGPGLDAQVCVSAFLHTPRVNAPTTPLLFQINSGTSSFQSPSGANSAYLFASVGIASMKPGTYTSTEAGACGMIELTYDLKTPPGLDCSSVTTPSSPADCPTGCTTECSGLGCEPCRANPPEVDYEAEAANFDCDGIAPSTVTGSWSVTLTSLTETDAGGGAGQATDYAAHGTFTASLPGSTDSGGDAGPGTARISVTF